MEPEQPQQPETSSGSILKLLRCRQNNGAVMYNRTAKLTEEILKQRQDPLFISTNFSDGCKILTHYATHMTEIEDLDSLDNWLIVLNDGVTSLNAATKLITFGHLETLLKILIQDLLGARKRHENQIQQQEKKNLEQASTPNDTETTTTKSDEQQQKPVLKCPPHHFRPVSNLLSIVQECLKQSQHLSILHLATNYELLEGLFSLLTQRFENEHNRMSHALRECVVAILDSILCSENDAPPVHLRLVNGLGDLLKNQIGTQDTHLFHVLSAMLSVSEFNAIAHSSLEKYDSWIVESGFSDVMESNHRFLLDQPGWLEHMCVLVCRPMIDVSRSIEAINQIFTRLELDGEGDVEAFGQQHFNRDGLFYQILLYKEKALRGDIFLLLSLLLSGKFRDEVQGRLVRSDCLIKLPRVFREVVWVVFQGHSNLLIQGSTVGSRDECCLDMFVRIQFLRFIYSIADNHQNRYLLLSSEDIAKLQIVAEKQGIEFPKSIQELVDQQLFVADEGVLMALISSLKQEPASSCVRFWITRALEAFLRGETISLNQAFLLEQKLVEDTVSLIISGCIQNEMVMQGSFDFLSTLMKFNLQAFERCNRVLDCTDKLRTLIRLTADNLVDSNMFLRCIILTAAHIKEKLPGQIDFVEECRLLQYFSKVEKQVDFAVKLNRLLTVSTLSQENVSCLNTSLLIMILANRRHQLSHYLTLISQMEDGLKLLRNMKHLLSFWLTHYTLPIKKADCKSLETSTAIKFSEWESVVGKLLNDDVTKPDSIEHHLHRLHRLPDPTNRRITQYAQQGRLS